MRAVIRLGLVVACLLAVPAVTWAQVTIVIDPANQVDVRVTRRATDRSKRIYLDVPKSAAVNVVAGDPIADKDAEIAALTARLAELETAPPAPPPPACTVTLSPPGPIPWATLAPGSEVCLEDGEYTGLLAPPAGLGGVTLRALNRGRASFPLGFDLAGNAVNLDGILLPCPGCPGGSALWDRKVTP